MNFRNTLKINEDNHLEIGGCDVTKLAEQYKTPLYIIDEQYIRDMCRVYKNVIASKYEDGEVMFASKALSNKAIYKICDNEEIGIDVVSGGELYTAMSVNFPGNKIVMHGNNKLPDEIELAIDYGVKRIVLDGLDDIALTNEIAREKNKIVDVELRVNPGVEAHTHHYVQTSKVDSKFGLSIKTGDAIDGVKAILAADHLNFCGLHSHIGSQIFEKKSFVLAVDVLLDFAKEIKDLLGVEISDLNMGGGYGIWYTDEDAKLTVEEYSNYLVAIIDALNCGLEKRQLKKPHLIIEPGRSIVGEAGITLYTVGNQKEIKGIRKYVGVDGGMFESPRYALYNAKYTPVVANRVNGDYNEKVTVCGKCCESGDMICVDVNLPSVKRGDLIAVLSTGAYNYSMASNYNRNAVPPMILVKDGRADYIVKPQDYEDIVRNDVVPSWLK